MANLLLALLVLALGLTVFRVSAADAPAGGTFEAQRDGDALLVNAKDAAKSIGYEAKLVSDGELLTLCRGTVCIPLRLSLTKHAVVEGRLHVDAAALAKANLEELIKPDVPVRAVPDEVRAKFQNPGTRLAERLKAEPGDLAAATALASRYLDLKLRAEAKAALEAAIAKHDAKAVAKAGGETASLPGQAYFQLARACEGDREVQVRHATTSFYLHPTIGFGKQISCIIAPEKFDRRPAGDFDIDLREGTLKRLQAEREAWLNAK
ncbi:MAG: hypothetical protein L6R28_17680 [Planctomycetes bacterium]|nr:hypothetical protein [Planctomycetota bacterium]